MRYCLWAPECVETPTKAWLTKFEWLVYDPIDNAMHCKLCKNQRAEGIWTTGTRTFRTKSLLQHVASKVSQFECVCKFVKWFPNCFSLIMSCGYVCSIISTVRITYIMLNMFHNLYVINSCTQWWQCTVDGGTTFVIQWFGE